MKLGFSAKNLILFNETARRERRSFAKHRVKIVADRHPIISRRLHHHGLGKRCNFHAFSVGGLYCYKPNIRLTSIPVPYILFIRFFEDKDL